MSPRIVSPIVVCAFLAVYAFLAACAFPLAVHATPAVSYATELALVPRGGISILEEGDFTAENGVVSGTGSSGDPFIIEDWEITLNNSGTCITVVDTSKYFVVRNVHLVGGKIAIRFEGVYHGRVTESVIENCSIGVSASFSEVSRVDNSLITNCSIGVSLRYCDAFKVKDNTFVDNDEDMRVIALPWIETRQADTVFAVIAVSLGAFVVGLLYLRYKSMRPPEERP